MKPYKTEKWQYERPAMQVVEIRLRTMILAGSGGMGSRGQYEEDDTNPFGN